MSREGGGSMGSGQAATLALSGASFSGPSSVPSIGDSGARVRAVSIPGHFLFCLKPSLKGGYIPTEVIWQAIIMQEVLKFTIL